MSQGTNPERLQQNNTLLEKNNNRLDIAILKANELSDAVSVEEFNKQDEIIAQQKEKLTELSNLIDLKATPGTTANVFMQETEPEIKNGIWLQGNYPVDNIIADRDIYASEEWNTSKMMELKPIPFNFYRGAAIEIGTDTYLFGGYGNSMAAYKYDTLTDTYTELTAIPFAFHQGGAVAIGTTVYLFGGASNTRVAYKYDTLTDIYTELTDIPYNFYGGGIAVVGTDIYLFGGEGKQNVTYKYDTLTDTYTQLANIPSYFYHGSTAAVDRNVYLFGGPGSSGRNTAYKYDTLENTYVRIQTVPFYCETSTAVTVDTDIYLLGSNSFADKASYKYDTLTNTYTKISSLPYPNYESSGVFTGTDIYLFGGYNTQTKVQILTMVPKEYPNNSIIISQSKARVHATSICNTNIADLFTYYDNAYYRNSEGVLMNSIPTYNGNGTSWTKIN